MHTAARHGSYTTLRILLRHAVRLHGFDGASAYACQANFGGNTPVHIAASFPQEHSSLKMVKLLIGHGAMPLVKNSAKSTPLHLACVRDSIATLRYLSETASMGSPDSLVAVVDKDGNTPLHVAAKYGAARCARYLMDKCKQMSFARNHLNKTPLDIASISRSTACQELLMMHAMQNGSAATNDKDISADMAHLRMSPVKMVRKEHLVAPTPPL